MNKLNLEQMPWYPYAGEILFCGSILISLLVFLFAYKVYTLPERTRSDEEYKYKMAIWTMVVLVWNAILVIECFAKYVQLK